MANDLISYIFGPGQFKLTDFKAGPVSLAGLSIIDVTIIMNGKLFKNPKEDGGFIVDGKIRTPVEVNVTVIVQTVDGAERINSILKNRDTIYSLTSRGVIIDNLLCTNQQITMSSDVLSAAPYRLTFRELPLQRTVQPTTLQPADSSIIDKGIAYVKETTDSVTSMANSAINKVKTSITGLF
ncbi:hypothetical protein KYLE_47 [Pantoea phage Kyle]|uniref:Uncharacterized protein n=1 Tax=Pantoea phage Kyle TaxID=2589665 RepID=A0A514A8K2_9CAUD|nr:tail fiber protein [Pantoea phage Kyle]QDH49603.1 hypothetical protein KYLE_47 [Pantoea phage Kyle]